MKLSPLLIGLCGISLILVSCTSEKESPNTIVQWTKNSDATISTIMAMSSETLWSINCQKEYQSDLTLQRVCSFEQADRKYKEFEVLSEKDKSDFDCKKLSRDISQEFSRENDCEQVKSNIRLNQEVDATLIKNFASYK